MAFCLTVDFVENMCVAWLPEFPGFFGSFYCEPRQDVCSCSCGGALPYICGRHAYLYIYPPWNEHSSWKWMFGILYSFLLGMPIFRGAMSVSGSVIIIYYNHHQKSWNIILHLFSWWPKNCCEEDSGWNSWPANFSGPSITCSLFWNMMVLWTFRSCWWIRCWEDYVTITVPWIDSRYNPHN